MVPPHSEMSLSPKKEQSPDTRNNADEPENVLSEMSQARRSQAVGSHL